VLDEKFFARMSVGAHVQSQKKLGGRLIFKIEYKDIGDPVRKNCKHYKSALA